MNYDFGSKVFTSEFEEIESPKKTSLILPPLSIGNMQKTIDYSDKKYKTRKCSKIFGRIY